MREDLLILREKAIHKANGSTEPHKQFYITKISEIEALLKSLSSVRCN